MTTLNPNDAPDGYVAVESRGCNGCAFAMGDTGGSCRFTDDEPETPCADVERKDMKTVIFVKRAAPTPDPQPAKIDGRKPCTCDGAGRGPGRPCVVKAGGRLGELWRCADGHEAAAPTPEPQAAQAVAADVWELVERFVSAEIDYHEALKSDIGLTAAVSKCNAIEEELRAALAAAAPVAPPVQPGAPQGAAGKPCVCDLAPEGWHGVTPRGFAARLRAAAPVEPPAVQPLTPLTDEQIDSLALMHAPPIHPDFTDDDDFIEFARATIEEFCRINGLTLGGIGKDGGA